MPIIVPENRAAKRVIKVTERLGSYATVSCGSDVGVDVGDVFSAHEEPSKVLLDQEHPGSVAFDDGFRVLLRVEVVLPTQAVCRVIREDPPGRLVLGDAVHWRPAI